MNKTQWQKRVELTQCFYSWLINDYNFKQILLDSTNYDFTSDQLKTVKYFASNKSLIEVKLIKYLAKDWSWSRINFVPKAIIYLAYCEFYTLNLPKPIVIDQALVTCEHYCQIEEKPFVNALLDKLLI